MSSKKIPSLGEQEMELLKFIDERSPISVRDVATHFESKLARTTILTMMERLRGKGMLSRTKVEGIFQYSAKFQTRDVLSSKISDFVERTLGGSVSPLFAYFSSSDLSADEVRQLKELAAKLETRKGD